MSGNNLRDALVDEIRDLYNAEKQLTKALPKLAKASTNEELRDAFESHLEETEGHVTRLERVFELLDEKPRGKHCAGMAGIIEEGSETLLEEMEDAVKDACIIKSAQSAEHYEIGSYGTAIAWAEVLELSEVAEILNETLAEEKAADEKLTALAESGINEAATAGESADDESEDDEEDDSAPVARSKSDSASARSASAGGNTRSASNGESATKPARARGGRR
jgi:ferritin-like metal-binding protein YciE